jgi:hypothetical protein
MTPPLDPAASIQIVTTARTRARVRLESHPAMADPPDALTQLAALIDDRVTMIDGRFTMFGALTGAVEAVTE